MAGGRENLRPWKPGQSGNPKGYSRGRRVTDAIIRAIDEDPTLAVRIADTLIAAALDDRDVLQAEYTSLKDGERRKYRRKPSAAFFSMLLERIEGKVKEEVEHSVAGGDLKSIRDYLEGLDDGPGDDGATRPE